MDDLPSIISDVCRGLMKLWWRIPITSRLSTDVHLPSLVGSTPYLEGIPNRRGWDQSCIIRMSMSNVKVMSKCYVNVVKLMLKLCHVSRDVLLTPMLRNLGYPNPPTTSRCGRKEVSPPRFDPEYVLMLWCMIEELCRIVTLWLIWLCMVLRLPVNL